MERCLRVWNLCSFVIDVKCDSEEGDLLCGKYTVRTKNVKHLCRACHCPTDQGDNPMAKHKMKMQKDIQRLVERGDRGKVCAKSVSKTSETHGTRYGFMQQTTEVFMVHVHLRCFMPFCWACSSI